LAGNLKYCPAFLALSASEKIGYLSYNNMCSKCLSISHISTSCASSDKDYASYLTSKAQLSLLSIPKAAEVEKRSNILTSNIDYPSVVPQNTPVASSCELKSVSSAIKQSSSKLKRLKSDNQVFLLKSSPHKLVAIQKLPQLKTTCVEFYEFIHNFTSTTLKLYKSKYIDTVSPQLILTGTRLLYFEPNNYNFSHCRAIILFEGYSNCLLYLEPKPPWNIKFLRAIPCVKINGCYDKTS